MSCIALLLLALAADAPAEACRYYMTVGAFERPKSFTCRSAHTFAIFAKATFAPNGEIVDFTSRTISWSDAKCKFPIFVFRAEKGKNLTLEETLAAAAKRNLDVTFFGPYEVKAELYQRALARIRELEERDYKWRNLDIIGRRRGKCFHCVHAVSDLDTSSGFLHSGNNWGATASWMVVKHLRHWIVGASGRDDVLALTLGKSRPPVYHLVSTNPNQHRR